MSTQGVVGRITASVLRLRIVRSLLRYQNHQGSLLADSITYRALFSVFAAVLLGFSAAALWLGGNPDAMRALSDSLDTVIPGISDVIDPESVSAPASFTIVGIISLAGLVGAAMSAIGRLRAALRILSDQITDDTFIVWVVLRNLAVAIAFGGLLAVAALMSVLSSVWIGTVTDWLGLSSDSTLTAALTRGIGIIVVLAVDTAAIALVFRLLSGVAAPARALWLGSLIGGIGLVVLQELSGLFVRGATSNPLLASFASLIALLIWFNLSAQVILIASSYIITATAESHDRVRTKYGASTLASWRRLQAEDRLRAAEQELCAAQEAEHEQLSPKS